MPRVSVDVETLDGKSTRLLWISMHRKNLRKKVGSDHESTELLAHSDVKVTNKHYRAKPNVIKSGQIL